MKYTKPEITLLLSAAKTVQDSEIKQEQMILDNKHTLATTAAYQADE